MRAAADPSPNLLVASPVAELLAGVSDREFALYLEAKSFAEAALRQAERPMPLIVVWRSVALKIDRERETGRYFVSAIQFSGPDDDGGRTLVSAKAAATIFEAGGTIWLISAPEAEDCASAPACVRGIVPAWSLKPTAPP